MKRIESVLAELDSARRRLISEVEGVQEPRFSTPPAAGQWSVGHVLEHLARSEEALARGIAAVMAGKLKAERRGSDWFGRVAYRLGLYRLVRARSREAFEPRETLSQPAAIARLAATREQLLATIEAGERRGIWSQHVRHPSLGPLSVAEMIGFMAWHEERHRMQIVRIKAALERAGK
ncbi:MAG: DinB family protein [Candidatus Eisenbacteria bacterium]